MPAAGWQVSDPPSIPKLSRAAVAAWLDRSHDTAPITPIFWNGWPQDFGFERSVPAEGLRQRHHARFWRVPSRDAGGLRVYLPRLERDVKDPEADILDLARDIFRRRRLALLDVET